MLSYLLSQGRGQLKIITEAVSIESAINEHQNDSLILHKLKLLKDVKNFAHSQLLFKTNNTFNKIYFPKSDTMQLMVINACAPLSFEAYTWDYPIIGKAPYKGFFNQQRLKQEYQNLKSKNLDVDVGHVEAWSTLGIISNPMMFTVLENSDDEITETILHECAHATLFIPGDSEFNESFAQFIGEKGAEIFFQKNPQNDRMKEKLQRKERQEILKKILFDSAQQLEKVYASHCSDEEKLRKKKQIIRGCCECLFQRKIYVIERTKRFALRLMKSGNAIFSAYKTYHSKRFNFEQELRLKYHNDLQKMMTAYKKSYSIE
jgi:predicted aminopeptidase